MAKILLIGVYYAPELTGIGINTAAMARSMIRVGHEVEVVTGMPHFPEWRVHPAYRGKTRMREVVEGVSVRRFSHWVPRRHTAPSRALYEITFPLHAATTHPDTQPDAVIAAVPTLTAAALARWWARRAHAPWGIIFFDLTGSAALQSGLPGGRSVGRMVSAWEMRLAKQADSVAVIADGFRPSLESGGVPAEKIHRIVNTNRASAVPADVGRQEVRRRLGWAIHEFVVLHTGNMGYKQALDAVVQAAALTTGDHRFRFVLMGDGNQRDHLHRLAKRLKTSNLDFAAAATAAEYPSVLAAADALLLHQRPTVGDMSLPGKLSNYFGSGIPVVAAVSERSETAAEVRRSGGAMLVPPADPPALIGALERLAGDPDLRRRLAERALAYEAARLKSTATFDVNRFLDTILYHRPSLR